MLFSFALSKHSVYNINLSAVIPCNISAQKIIYGLMFLHVCPRTDVLFALCLSHRLNADSVNMGVLKKSTMSTQSSVVKTFQHMNCNICCHCFTSYWLRVSEALGGCRPRTLQTTCNQRVPDPLRLL